MFRENESLLLSSRAKREISVFPIGGNLETSAFGWRSGFTASMRARYLAFRWNEPVGFQPRSGVRIQATAQAVGKVESMPAPTGRKSSSHPHTFSAAIYALKSAMASAAEVIKARLLRETEAAAIIEFAVALPLLIVLVVGIFDFGGAFNLKQELNNAAREGARFGAAQPTNDLSTPTGQPPSVNAVRYLVDSYLQTAHINDCGLNSDTTTTWAFAGGNLDWHFSATANGCTMTMDVTRAVPFQTTIGGNTVNTLCTTVQISYPYQWHFNNVIQLLVPGAHYSLLNIQSNATAVNMN
jgi:Flp pilus assembly protein TadG